MPAPRFPHFIRVTRNRATQTAAALTLAFALVAGLACDENAPTETRAPLERPATATGADDLNLAEGDISTLAIPLPVNQSVATTAPDPAFRVNQTGTGPNGIFQISRPGNNRTALQGITNGRGIAGVFEINNTLNTQPALLVRTNGRNIAVIGITTGTSAAASFQISNPSNDQPALAGTTHGSGVALQAVATSSTGGGGFFAAAGTARALSVLARGNGGAMLAETRGTGTAGTFSVVNHSGFNPYALEARGNPDVTNPKAALLAGDVDIQGTLTKSAGSFRIDHPLDPEHKYLSHSFVESPDMKNVYDGTVTLDENGRATVELPDYFEALNRDFRYQLTAIGSPGPNLYIAEGVKENRFRIAGGRPYARVSWMVTGVRQDAYAEEHRIKVEEEKPRANGELVARR